MTTKTTAVELAAEMTIAWISNRNNRATVNELPVILKSVHDAIANLATGADGSASMPQMSEHAPAVSVRKSLANRDHIVSLIDGKPYKSLRRHLRNNGLTPDDYRERYGLKPDYPMVSEGYSEVRRAMAMKIGLGRKSGQRSTPPTETKPDILQPGVRRKTKAVASEEVK